MHVFVFAYIFIYIFTIFINVLYNYFCLYFIGVRLDRVRGGRQKYKRSPDSQPLTQYPIHSQTIIKKSCLERK